LSRLEENLAADDVLARRGVEDIDEVRDRIALLDDVERDDVDGLDGLAFGRLVDRLALRREDRLDRLPLVRRIRGRRRRFVALLGRPRERRGERRNEQRREG